MRALEELAAGVEGIVALVGFAEPVPPGPTAGALTTPSGVLADGGVQLGLSQEPPAELRRLRRAALFRAGRGSRR